VVAALAAFVVADGERINRKKNPGPLSSCGVKGASAPSSQIVNGQDATECEWRWQAQLRTSYAFCGGTLISPEWVLTAAHCVDNTNFDVRVGDFDTSKTSANQQTRAAAEVYKHPGYNARTTQNDYALVKLSSPVTINDCVGTACLPTAGEDVTAGQKCWITGWGTTRSGGSSPKILQESAINIVSNDDCVNKFGYSASEITDAMICAQGRNANGSISDACQGDSGGPLVCESNGKWAVYGATSWGYGCAGATHPGVWARVHEELDWIEDIMAGIVPTPAPTPPGQGCDPATSTGPDSDGDCKCNSGLRCYEGGQRGCTYSYTASSGYTSTRWFLESCGSCKCS